MSLTLRRGGAEDAPALARIYRAAILRGAKGSYSAAERLAWAGLRLDLDHWRTRLSDLDLWVLDQAGLPIGFAALQGDCFDLLFVHPDHHRQGHARRLHEAVLTEARRQGLSALVAHASHVSRPAFARFGWQVVEEDAVERRGVLLRFTVMRLALCDQDERDKPAEG